MFNKQVLLITGGTGSFGNAVLQRFLNSNVSEIRILSRDEKKQEDMRKKYNNPKVKFYIGDVRDYRSLENAVRGSDYIFHAAALKQVPSCEFYPLEAVKTNILGTENILEAAIKYGVKKVICLSTDKAVYPINAMGISKAMMEKVLVSKSRTTSSTVLCATRYGNVMASRGSVIPLFVNQILNNRPISVTDLNMTRFMMTLDDAVNLVIFAFENAMPGDIFVQKAPASSMNTLIEALKLKMEVTNHKLDIIGTRHGEKLYETLLSREEIVRAKDFGDYYCIPPDSRDLNYPKYFELGNLQVSDSVDYNSHNTKQLSIQEMFVMLEKLPFIQSVSQGKYIEPDI